MTFRGWIGRRAWVAIALVGMGCERNGSPASLCSPPAPCGLPCCTSAEECRASVCEGVLWVCRRLGDESFGWVENGQRCVAPPTDGGGGPVDLRIGARDASPDRLRADSQTSCTGTSCGAHAACGSAGCGCVKGYANLDGRWDNGCEALHPTCAANNCDACPDGYCGVNARCTDRGKCRCASGAWRNLDEDWKNGCETPSIDCRPDNCNACYTAYCGPQAQCQMSICGCDTPGYANCDGLWEQNGCECKGTCGGDGKCRPSP
ncbi:MAG: hypothetical protein IT371_27810 [Deltaproteobacteria bacterium]|nr:hypothetical protein [Deltaproteobacteria bacterium]